MPNALLGPASQPRALKAVERSRLVALLRSVKKATRNELDRRRPLGNGFELLVTGENRALRLRIFSKNNADPGVDLKLAHSISMADLARLRDTKSRESYGLKMARRMERRERILNGLAEQILGNPKYASLIEC